MLPGSNPNGKALPATSHPRALASIIVVSLGGCEHPHRGTAEASGTATLLKSTRLPAQTYAPEQRRCSMMEVLHSSQACSSLTTSHSAPAKPQPEAGDPAGPPHVPLSPHTWPCSWRERESSLFSRAASFSWSPSSSSCSRSFSSCRCAMEAITFWITGKGRATGRLVRFPVQSLPPAVGAKTELFRIQPPCCGTGWQPWEKSSGAAMEMRLWDLQKPPKEQWCAGRSMPSITVPTVAGQATDGGLAG